MMTDFNRKGCFADSCDSFDCNESVLIDWFDYFLHFDDSACKIWYFRRNVTDFNSLIFRHLINLLKLNTLSTFIWLKFDIEKVILLYFQFKDWSFILRKHCTDYMSCVMIRCADSLAFEEQISVKFLCESNSSQIINGLTILNWNHMINKL